MAPDQLGTIFASQVDLNWRNPTEVLPGESIREQFATIEEHKFRIDLSNLNFSGQVFQVIKDPSGQTTRVLLPGSLDKSFFLEPGVYQVVATNNALTPQQVAFSITVSDDNHDSLSLGGVGQLPAILSQATLIGNGSSTTGNQNVIGPRATVEISAGPVALARLASDADQEGAQARVTREQPSISFNSAALIQSPLGALSGSISVDPVAAIPAPATGLSASVASAMHSAIFLNPGLPGLRSDLEYPTRQSRTTAPALPVPESATGPESSPANFAADASVPDGPALPPAREPAGYRDPVVVSAGAAHNDPATTDSDSASVNWLPYLGELELVMVAEADGLESATDLADLTNPICILVATCIVAHRLKATKIGANLPDRSLFRRFWRRDWSWFRGGNQQAKACP